MDETDANARQIVKALPALDGMGGHAYKRRMMSFRVIIIRIICPALCI